MRSTMFIYAQQYPSRRMGATCLWKYKEEEGRRKSYFEIMVNIGLHVKVWPLVQVYDIIGQGKWGHKE